MRCGMPCPGHTGGSREFVLFFSRNAKMINCWKCHFMWNWEAFICCNCVYFRFRLHRLCNFLFEMMSASTANPIHSFGVEQSKKTTITSNFMSFGWIHSIQLKFDENRHSWHSLRTQGTASIEYQTIHLLCNQNNIGRSNIYRYEIPFPSITSWIEWIVPVCGTYIWQIFLFGFAPIEAQPANIRRENTIMNLARVVSSSGAAYFQPSMLFYEIWQHIILVKIPCLFAKQLWNQPLFPA